jgi:hypothetical protein
MKHRAITNLVFVVMFCLIISCSQKKESSGIELNNASIENRINYAVWRADFYICSGIAYAKSVGKSPDDFMNFIAETHVVTLQPMKGMGPGPFVELLHLYITNYPNGTFKVLSESENTVNIEFNRPYKEYFTNSPYHEYFEDGKILGVTLEEFEKCLWGHFQIMLKSMEINFEYQIKDDSIEALISSSE